MIKFVIGLLLVCSVIYADAQKIDELFIKMPENMIVQLEEAWRKDLVELYKSGKTASLENTMQGRSTIQTMTDDYMLLQSTERSTVELKLLPLVNNTFIICMIETVYAPVADSRVSFYTIEWELLADENIFTPATEGLFLKDDADISLQDLLNVRSKLDMFLVKYSLSEEDTSLIAEYTTPQYVSDEYKENAKSLLKVDSKTFKWKSGRFE